MLSDWAPVFDSPNLSLSPKYWSAGRLACVRPLAAPAWLISRTISRAAASMFLIPSLTPISPKSILNRRTKSMLVQCGKCCKRDSSCVDKSRTVVRIPLSAKNTGMHRVPSGVSK